MTGMIGKVGREGREIHTFEKEEFGLLHIDTYRIFQSIKEYP